MKAPKSILPQTRITIGDNLHGTGLKVWKHAAEVCGCQDCQADRQGRQLNISETVCFLESCSEEELISLWGEHKTDPVMSMLIEAEATCRASAAADEQQLPDQDELWKAYRASGDEKDLPF